MRPNSTAPWRKQPTFSRIISSFRKLMNGDVIALTIPQTTMCHNMTKPGAIVSSYAPA